MNRGVKDVLFFCIDELAGLMEGVKISVSMEKVFPDKN